MKQVVKFWRWTNTRLTFLSRTSVIAPHEIEFCLLSVNNSSSSDKQAYSNQINKVSQESIPQQTRRGKLQLLMSLYSTWMQRYLGLIDVQSKWLLVWNTINYFAIRILLVRILILLLNDSIFVSQTQKASFGNEPYDIFFVLFFLDMIFVRYRVLLLIKGKFLKNPPQLLKRYLKRLFLIDLITLILLVIRINGYWEWQYAKVLIFLKYQTALQMNSQIRYKLISYRFILVIYFFFRFLLSLILWSTFYAGLYLIIVFQYVYEQGQYYEQGMVWLTASPGIVNINLYDQFQWKVWFEYALFFILQTIRGCGYGITTPRNPVQVLFANFSMLTFMAFFANYTRRIIDISVDYSINKQQLLFEATLNLRTIQQSYKISESNRVKYLQQITRKQKKDSNLLEKWVQSSFSEDLKGKFMYHLRNPFILASKFLYDISDEEQGLDFRKEISLIVYKKKTFKGEYLYKRGIFSQQILYLSQDRGVITKNQELGVFYRQNNWNLIGLREFFLAKRPIFDIVSIAILEVYYLRKTQFMQILKKYTKIYQKYREVIDSISFNREDTQILMMVCLFCKRYHLLEQCCLFNPMKKNVLLQKKKKYNKNEDRPRTHYQRTKISSQKSKLKRQTITEDRCYPCTHYYVSYTLQY